MLIGTQMLMGSGHGTEAAAKRLNILAANALSHQLGCGQTHWPNLNAYLSV